MDGREHVSRPACWRRRCACELGRERCVATPSPSSSCQQRYLRQVDRAKLAEQLAPLFGRDLAEQPPVVMKQVRAMSRYDAGPGLKALAGMPTLVLSAAEDRIAEPRFGRELAQLIPGARYVEIEGGGHGVTIQLADKVNELFIEHLRSAETCGSQVAASAAASRSEPRPLIGAAPRTIGRRAP